VRYFAVTMVHGPAFDESRGLREQDGWDAHAAFMDDLVDEGVVILGGPLENEPGALLIFDAESEDAIRRRMAGDPWAEMDILHVGSVQPWLIWLDGR
jgi:uncharacterized protein YciI